MSSFNPLIGEYIFHTYSGTGPEIIVVTTSGKLIIPVQILTTQENDPEMLDDITLRLLALSVY